MKTGCCGAGLVCGLGEVVVVAVGVVVGRAAAGGEGGSLGHLGGQTLVKETDHASLEYDECHYAVDGDDLGYGQGGEKLGAVRIDGRAIVRLAAVGAAVVVVGFVVVSVEHGFLAEVEMAVAPEMPIGDSVGH